MKKTTSPTNISVFRSLMKCPCGLTRLLMLSTLEHLGNHGEDEDCDDNAKRYRESRLESSGHGIFSLNPG
jgi:hypothetical protein